MRRLHAIAEVYIVTSPWNNNPTSTLGAKVSTGDCIETTSGWRYHVLSIRVQRRDKRTSWQTWVAWWRRRADLDAETRVHRIRWYARGAAAAAVIDVAPLTTRGFAGAHLLDHVALIRRASLIGSFRPDEL